jgi:DNA-binding MarR family transcriptional regulator
MAQVTPESLAEYREWMRTRDPAKYPPAKTNRTADREIESKRPVFVRGAGITSARALVTSEATAPDSLAAKAEEYMAENAPAKKSVTTTPKETPMVATPKTATAPEKKAPKAKKTAAPAPAPETNGATEKKGREKKDGLRKPQIRILDYLAGAKGPVTRKTISEEAQVDRAGLTEWIGSDDKTKRLANDTKHFPSLLSLALIRSKSLDQNGVEETVYEITASGRKAIAKLSK